MTAERRKTPTGNLSPQLVTERVLLSALREQDAAAASEAARRRAEFLADVSLRFASSLDEELTYAAIAEIALPGPGAWCIVDVVEASGGLRRLAVVHPDEAKQAAARALAHRWPASPEGPIGVAAVRPAHGTVILPGQADASLAASIRDPETLRVLRWLGSGSMFVVPMMAHGELLGAITFVSRPDAPAPTGEDIEFGEALAARCGQAIESARLYSAARASLAEAQAARSEAESARASAEAANAAKAQFLSTMSHELRTPLNAIAGYAQLLEMGVRGPITPEQRTDLASIQRNQAHLLGLVDAVLNYAQIGAGRAVYSTGDIPLVEVVKDIESFITPQVRAKGLTYRFEPCTHEVTVCADAGKVRQIVLNLIGNAIKFTPRSGRITVTCLEPEADVLSRGDRISTIATVRVTDSGIGIAADHLESIFDPFVQVGRGFTSPGTGVGLGLAISRDLARGMGGDVTVESTPNVGSTFTLVLPVGSKDAASAKAAAPAG